MLAHQWLGREAMYLDAPHLASCGDMVIGCYGGNRRAGANKNEDGVLECGTRPFERSRLLYDMVMGEETAGPLEMQNRIGNVLARVHEEVGRDSATVIQWGIENALSSVYPSG